MINVQIINKVNSQYLKLINIKNYLRFHNIRKIQQFSNKKLVYKTS